MGQVHVVLEALLALVEKVDLSVEHVNDGLGGAVLRRDQLLEELEHARVGQMNDRFLVAEREIEEELGDVFHQVVVVVDV